MESILQANCSDLKGILGDFITDERTLDILEDEGINGSSFSELTQEDLRSMKIKMGPAKELLKIISSIKKNVTEDSYIVNEDGSLQKLNEKDLEVDEPTINIRKRKNDEIHNITEKEKKQKDDKRNDNSTATFADKPSTSFNSPSTSKTVDLHKFSSRYNTVEKILLNHKQGVQIVNATKKGFTDSHRRSMIRILVQELVNTHSPYPPHEAKMELARAIVTEFPKLKNTKSSLGFEHFYDPNTKLGFIHYRLQGIQKSLEIQHKKYRKSTTCAENDQSKENFNSSNLDLLPEDILEEKISWMKHKYPTSSNQESITNYMKETFLNRRNWILEKSPTVSEIFNKYERLADYDGDLVDCEFSLMFPDIQDSFITKFPTFFMPRIIKYAEFCKTNYVERHDNINDDSLKALMVLVDLLPVSNAVKNKKRSKKSDKSKDSQKSKKSVLPIIVDAHKMLLEIVPAGTAIDDFIKTKRMQSLSPVQPYLLCVEGEIMKFFLVAENVILSRKNQDDAISSFDLLFKLYYILNIEYPVLLQNFYNFIESYVYEITEKKSFGTVTSLFINLVNMNLDEIQDSDE